MSWWGSSGSSDKDSSSSSSSDSSSYDTSSSSSAFSSNESAAPQYSAPISNNALQEQLQLEQQKAMIQTVMLKLTDIAFDHCVHKPSSSLSSSEVSCINATVGKYLETSEFIVSKLSQQAGGNTGGF